jgi:drug/metabolite transporter (DMT)-like permease
MSPASAAPRAPLAANVHALGAIALWSSLASLAVQLAQVPPFLLTGLALLIGSVPAWPFYRQWRVAPRAFALGVGGIFGYHFLLFIALRHAPPVQANLVNYLWPLLMVLLAPALLPGLTLRPRHLGAAAAGLGGAAIAILGGSTLHGGFAWGYLPAFGAALTWASFSLGSRRLVQKGLGFPTAAIGLFALVSGLLALLCHAALEPAAQLAPAAWMRLLLLGLGPLGAAFYLWDRGLKLGDARTIGVLSYITPLASTTLLLWTTGRAFNWSLGLAALLIVGAALVAVSADA